MNIAFLVAGASGLLLLACLAEGRLGGFVTVA